MVNLRCVRLDCGFLLLHLVPVSPNSPMSTSSLTSALQESRLGAEVRLQKLFSMLDRSGPVHQLLRRWPFRDIVRRIVESASTCQAVSARQSCFCDSSRDARTPQKAPHVTEDTGHAGRSPDNGILTLKRHDVRCWLSPCTRLSRNAIHSGCSYLIYT